ncbi:MAG: class I SAM-dependent methyltransferase [Chitinophagaceae bacterium]|nr:class I SAM-dependent methyltransferase [Chitinophagaceae bacterium]
MKFRAIARQLRKPGGWSGKKVGNSMNKANRFLYEKLIEIICLQPVYSILEIGFGNGCFFPNFFEKMPGLHMTGIDYSLQMVKAAKRRNKKV